MEDKLVAAEVDGVVPGGCVGGSGCVGSLELEILASDDGVAFSVVVGELGALEVDVELLDKLAGGRVASVGVEPDVVEVHDNPAGA